MSYKFLIYLIAVINADYKLIDCYQCSRETEFTKVCNLGNNAQKVSSSVTNPYVGACCHDDDTSKYCKNEKDGGYEGSKCSIGTSSQS
jgi:hypothetical protein